MSSTPMKLDEVSKGKHWFTRLTTWSKSRLYTALARASRALFACSTLRGTLQGHTKWGRDGPKKPGHCRTPIKSLSFIYLFLNQPNFHLTAKVTTSQRDTFCSVSAITLPNLTVKLGDRFKTRVSERWRNVLKLKYEPWTRQGSLTTLQLLLFWIIDRGRLYGQGADPQWPRVQLSSPRGWRGWRGWIWNDTVWLFFFAMIALYSLWSSSPFLISMRENKHLYITNGNIPPHSDSRENTQALLCSKSFLRSLQLTSVASFYQIQCFICTLHMHPGTVASTAPPLLPSASHWVDWGLMTKPLSSTCSSDAGASTVQRPCSPASSDTGCIIYVEKTLPGQASIWPPWNINPPNVDPRPTPPITQTPHHQYTEVHRSSAGTVPYSPSVHAPFNLRVKHFAIMHKIKPLARSYTPLSY